MPARLSAIASKTAGSWQQGCRHMAAMLPAYGSNHTNQDARAK
jgi:hypothetical protein